tara:strand:- start:3787 stop:4029 length:243 start_codon:yes stop_codon:yes gene_type:complete
MVEPEGCLGIGKLIALGQQAKFDHALPSKRPISIASLREIPALTSLGNHWPVVNRYRDVGEMFVDYSRPHSYSAKVEYYR